MNGNGEQILGSIGIFGGAFVVRDYSFCNGQLMPIHENQALYALIGTFYGGDGRTTFALPDLREKSSISQGEHPGSYYDWEVGQHAGNETHTLTLLELPQHSHSATFTSDTGSVDVSLQATTTEGNSATPADGSYLAKSKEIGSGGGADYLYSSNPGTKVNLGGIYATGTVPSGTVAVGSSGASQSFNIMQPMLVLNCSIALKGLFPSRN